MRGAAMQSPEIASKHRNSRAFPIVVLLAIMALLPAAGQDAQEAPKPVERTSKPGENQTWQKKVKVANRAVMKPEQRPVATPINGKTLRMEEALKTSPKVAEGKLQPNLDLAQA